MKTLFTAVVQSSGGRDGHIKSQTGDLDLKVSLPKSLGGSGAAGTNPEELFAAGYSACYENALIHVARASKIALAKTAVTAHVSIGTKDGKSFDLAVTLVVDLPGLEFEAAKGLIHKAHNTCPYSRGILNNVPVATQLVTSNGLSEV